MSRRTTDETVNTVTGDGRQDEAYEVLFTWYGGDSEHSIEDGLDEFFRASRVRRVRTPLSLLASIGRRSAGQRR